MSDTHLPANLNDWPDNPYAILGVKFGIDPRDLRRVYTQLIRQYKPEQFPEHFRRIREAYEAMLRHVPFFGKFAPQPSADTEVPRAEEPPELERCGPDLLEQMQAQWELACRGDVAEAYRGLRLLYEQHPASDELCIRLYWLLTLAPELDSIRTASDWLVSGLRANGGTGQLRELYRRELAGHPDLAGDESDSELLIHLAGTPQVLDLASWLWLAAARLQRWAWILSDIAALRKRVSDENPERWVRLLLTAVDHLAWAKSKDVRQQTALYWREIQRHEEFHLRLGTELDRIEQLLNLSAKWQSFCDTGALPFALANLISIHLDRPGTDVRPRLDVFIAAVADQPQTWLQNLRKIQKDAPELIDAVLRILQSYQPSMYGSVSIAREGEDTDIVIADFLDLQDKMPYKDFRKLLLEFCLTEVIAPSAVASFVAGRKEYAANKDEHLSQIIPADTALQCVWLAHQILWA